MSEIYGENVFCNFANMTKVDCDNCTSPYLIQCGNPQRMGFVSGQVLIIATESVFGERKRLSLEDVYELIEDEDCFTSSWGCGPPKMNFEIIDNTPMYKTPLGQQLIYYAGYNLKGEEESCHYTPVQGPMISSFKSPKKVMFQVGGLQQTVCYGNISCLKNKVLGKPSEYLVHRAACTALPGGECPTPQECMEDPSVRFEQVAEIEETVDEDVYDEFRDQIRLEIAMEQIRQDVKLERLEDKIEQVVADKIKQLDPEVDETQERGEIAVSNSLEARMKAIEEWVNVRRALLEEMNQARGNGRRSSNSGIR